jgi:hypothetical protein
MKPTNDALVIITNYQFSPFITYALQIMGQEIKVFQAVSTAEQIQSITELFPHLLSSNSLVMMIVLVSSANLWVAHRQQLRCFVAQML